MDFSQWHTWGVTWLPGHLSCTVDGKTWAVIEDAGVGKVVVPTTPMHFGIQTTMGSPGKAKPDETTPHRGQPAYRRRDGLALRA